MAMNKCWAYLVDDHKDPSTILQALYRLNINKTTYIYVSNLFYGLWNQGKLRAYEIYTLFLGEKDENKINDLLPEF